MNRNQVTMQLYTTRKFQPYEPIFKFLSESGIKNIELFDLDKIDLDNFKSMMEENSISIKSSHISFQAITNTEETISRMKYLNIKHAIVPSVPEKFSKDFASNFDLDEDTWNNFGKDLSSYVQTYEDNGLTLGYHNHSFEFRPLPSGKLPIECMMDHNENLKMELDLGWAVAGKADPLDWIEKYKNKNELTVTFDDGFSNTLSSELLRVESPSAEVQGHGPNQKKTPSQKSRVVIEDIEPVGNYAVAIKFDDGHNTGIFSWSYLQKLSLEKDKLWKDYLKRVDDLKIER